jgi:hypothetical protein
MKMPADPELRQDRTRQQETMVIARHGLTHAAMTGGAVFGRRPEPKASGMLPAPEFRRREQADGRP